jgi:hypothetical protein
MITVQPNPATSGQLVTITVTGAGPYQIRVVGSGDDWVDLPIDPETGEATYQVDAPGGSSLAISDRNPPDSDSLTVPVNSTS